MWAQFCSSNDYIINDRAVYLEQVFEHHNRLVNWDLINDALMRDDMFFELIDNMTQRKVEVGSYHPYWSYTKCQDKEHIYDHIMKGETFVISSFSKSNESVKGLCREIEGNFEVIADAHVYGSLMPSKSFKIHYDHFPNFIFQCEGETEWTVYKNRATALWNALNDRKFRAHDLEVDVCVTMKPGDVLYIPDRALHCAKAKTKRLSVSIPCAPRILNGQPYDRANYKIPSN